MDHIAVVGAGQAGASAVETLRKEGFAGRLTLWGDEPHLPYQRPPLSKAYLLGEMERERLYLRPRTFYDEHGVELHLGERVTALDPAARTLTHGGGTEGWDAAILATGSAANTLPERCTAGLPGTRVIRTLADIDALAPEMVPGRRLLVVGGGYIGLEAAAVARKMGLEVVLVELSARLLSRVACEETAAWFRALHRDHGVDLREGVGLDTLLGGGRIEGARLTDGTEIAVDLVLAGIGAHAVTDLAEAAGLTCANGVVVDEMGRTSAAGVWAAGDCAAFPWKGDHVRLESVPHAIDHAQAVARNVLGAEAPYVAKPWFWSDQYEVKLQIAGLNTGFDRVVVREDAGRSHWYYAGDRLLAVDAMNDPRAYMVGKRLIEAGRSPDPAAVADGSVPVKNLMA
ncbi:NAD(P)/FAD-dependent oxidoreductase [Jannaschia seohaensis]|uniref:3-phenylpropionate/trans-cinnamate dioxygenase ferredoxin reductase subunit n=1 Tax=Jannaschia seohaensis TaxID=475081 RepID=A0A2Y9A257_9RHOB|nr:FAD-dependent oxidoreductase [Jannaschia seohaensis]PWJ22206.1 3-phenylpropionate/trans-cinnamate dioxygenase ferredoxin reductase subunit [Jannaschia seohaensis]SSA38484.1 3-phenylpropionate/trans-cinnamate dioxygenase ferredoxin reductase subunit [Jannaschia seohaensis]